jgi:hypothetical protein
MLDSNGLRNTVPDKKMKFNNQVQKSSRLCINEWIVTAVLAYQTNTGANYNIGLVHVGWHVICPCVLPGIT